MDAGVTLSLRLRLGARRLLATWLCLLRAGAGWRRRQGALRSRRGQARREGNSRRQAELRALFAPYHRFCPACGSFCCREPQIPFSDLDVLIYGEPSILAVRPPAKPAGARARWLSCLRGRDLYRKLQRFTAAASEEAAAPGPVFCPALGEAGCRLPWGARPAVCVFCACPQILKEMAWPDVACYIWINLKYLTHLTLAVLEPRSKY